MAIFNTPPTVNTGDSWTAANQNTYIQQNMLALRNDAGIIRMTAAQAIATATFTPLDFDTEDEDDAGFFDLGANPTRLTFPYDGVFLVVVEVAWDTDPAGYRELRLRRNGVGTDKQFRINGDSADNAPFQDMGFSHITTRLQNDYYELEVYQDTGVNLDAELAKMSVVTIRNDDS